MKRLIASLFSVFVLLAPVAIIQSAAQAQGSEAKVVVYQCTTDEYASKQPGFCPYCGMKLQGKEVSSEAAEALVAKSK